MRKPGTIFLFAIVIGALSAALVYRNLQSQYAELEAMREANQNKIVEILVAKGSIPIGTKILPDQVRRIAWPASAEPEGALHDLDEAVGHVARTRIERNSPIVHTSLVRAGSGLLPLLIDEGMRAMSVKVDTVTGISGFITPDSRVDVLIAGKPQTNGGRGDQEERSKIVLQNVKVLATGTSIEQVDEKPIEVPTVTLLLKPTDAERLALATRHAPVRLALRNYRDETLVGTPGIAAAALFGIQEVAVKAPVPVKVVTHRPRRAQRPRYTVDVFLGDKLTQQVLN